MLLFKFIIILEILFYLLFGFLLYIPVQVKRITTSIIRDPFLPYHTTTVNENMMCPTQTTTEGSVSTTAATPSTSEATCPLPSCFSDDDCGILCETGNDGGTVFSPGYPGDYGNNRRCVISITVCKDNRIELKFNEFTVEDEYDMIYIREGPLMEKFLGNLTGYKFPENILSTKNLVKIDFRSNVDNSLIPTGKIAHWKISFKVV